MSEIKGMNSGRTSVLVSFCARLMRGSEQAMRSGEGVYRASASNADGRVCRKDVARATCLRSAPTAHESGTLCKCFHAAGLFWLCRCKALKGKHSLICERFEQVAGRNGFKAS